MKNIIINDVSHKSTFVFFVKAVKKLPPPVPYNNNEIGR